MLENIFSLPIQYTIIYIALAFVLGAVVGSFLNVVILRVPRHERISGVKNRSHCMSCGHTLGVFDLVPIFSYIFLGGKCRYCKEKISPRYWIVETVTAIMYVLSLIALGLSYKLLIAFVLIPALIVASGIDIDTMEIPYGCSLLIASLGVIAIVLSFFTHDTVWYEHLIGAVIIAVPFALLAMFGAMGGGDVQLMAASGLLLGWNVVPAAAIGIVLGAIGGLIEMMTVPKGTRKKINSAVTEIAEEWYERQRENGVSVVDGKTEAIYGSIFGGKSDIDHECIDKKYWNGEPDIDSLNAALNERLGEYTKFGILIVIAPDKIKSVDCKKQIIFGPYLSLGVVAGLMFGKLIINWYLGLFNY